VRLRQALRADIERIADLYVDAFADDPFLRWMQPADDGWPAFGRAWFGFVIGLGFERGNVFVGDSFDVAVSWIPPDLPLATADDIARGSALLDEHLGDAHGAEVLQTIVSARSHEPEPSHWVLSYVAVRPSAQGRGFGASSIAPVLDRCDAEGLPAYLVSTNARNLPFYGRAGFEVIAEVPTPDGATAIRPMWRAPRAGAP
jgi:GNAT superfamily N-acetyltransferase